MKILITENQLSSIYDAYITHSFGNLRKKTKKKESKQKKKLKASKSKTKVTV